ncbi:hypothetical protein CYMTET_4079 [Cymbomonas tetramitiformis]|uniref:N-alpha-acetyltransferase 40 n=1 Tax=Cymbomonas tetramitiformis TaxID=36881 RepID=A0AAE0H1U0_9CHLO|nr:hypothetical protein CYMTET_4079 [Cymbomonas tetramitiformis]
MRATPREHIDCLKKALYDELGNDRNVLGELAVPFRQYERNGLSISLDFHARLPHDLLNFAFKLTKKNMRAVYESSEYGWCKEDKIEELRDKSARFLVGRTQDGTPVAFVNFRFTLQGEMQGTMEGNPTLFIYDIQLSAEVQRKGLGKHLMQILELVARKHNMEHIILPVVQGNAIASDFVLRKLRGYSPEREFNQDLTFDLLSKTLGAAKAVANSPASPLERTKGEKGCAPSPVSVMNFPSAVSTPEPASCNDSANPERHELREPYANVEGLDTKFANAVSFEGDSDVTRAGPVRPTDPVASVEGQEGAAAIGGIHGAQSCCRGAPEEASDGDIVPPVGSHEEEAGVAAVAPSSLSVCLEELRLVPEDDGIPERCIPFDGPSAWSVNSDGGISDDDDLEQVAEEDHPGALVGPLDDQAADLLGELVELFQERNGREPTEAEMAQWMETIKAATEQGELDFTS